MIKKIKTQSEVQNEKRKHQIIIGIILVALLVLATVGYSFLDRNTDGDSNKAIENGVEFIKSGEVWITQIDGAVFQFFYLPSEVINVSVNGTYNFAELSAQPVYFSEFNEGAANIIANFGRFFERYQRACYSNCTEDLPIKTCGENFIIFENGNDSVSKEDGCIFLKGDPKKTADALMYKFLKLN